MTINTSRNLLIDEKTIKYAKIYSALLKDEFQRKRAYSSLVALYALIGLLETTGYNIQKSMTIFRNPEINEKFEISDFYINNWHIDVRIITEGEAFLVPKIHFDYSITPDFYAVVKINKELNAAEILGFADAKNMKKDVLDYHYYSVDNSNLTEYEKFVDIVQNEKNVNFSEKEHEFFKESYLSLVDKEIDEDTKARVLKHLFECPECRTEFCCFTGFEMVNCNLGSYPDILNDQMLNIVGAQDTDAEKYEGKEETIYIGDDEEFEKYPEDEFEEYPNEEKPQDNETVSDILDELFNVEEETVEIPVNQTLNPETELVPDDNIAYIDEGDNNIPVDNGEDLQMIVDNGSDITLNDGLEEFKDIENIEIEPTEELMLLNDESGDDLLKENSDIEKETKEEDVDKVIIDYDENGEPIYSYITNVNAEDYTNNAADIIEPIDDVQITEEYPSEPIVETIEDAVADKVEDFVENTTEEVKSAVPDDILDYPSEETNDIELEKQPSYEDEIQNIDDEEFAESDSDINYEDNANNTDEYTDETSEYETEEDEEEDIGGPEVKAKSSSKTGLLVALALVVLAVPAAILGTKYIKSATVDSNVSTQVPDAAATNDMFEQPEESTPSGDDIIPAESTSNNDIEIQQNDSSVIADTQKTEEKAVSDLTESDLITKKPTNDVNKVMADAFSQNAAHVSVSGVNWMCAPALFTDKAFKNYMQEIDKVLKLNLNKNILDATQSPVNNAVAVKFAVDNNGNLLKSQIASSSGSDEIDNIVLQSIKETLETQKTTILTDSAQKADKYMLKVVIKL